jgi:phage major head subunit gpT-like protein
MKKVFQFSGLVLAAALMLMSPSVFSAVAVGMAGAGVMVTSANLLVVQKGLNTLYAKAMTDLTKGPDSIAKLGSMIALESSSTSAAELYNTLNDVDDIRQWVGDRFVDSLANQEFEIPNLDFEKTIGVKRTHIEDNKLGTYNLSVQLLAGKVSKFTGTNLVKMLKVADTTKCADGQFLCDVDHDSPSGASQSNWGGGSGERWFLVNRASIMRPFLVQKRKEFEFTSLFDPKDQNVFMRNEFLYGVDGRYGCGAGVWHTIYGSRQTLNAASYAAAVAAMENFVSPKGSVIGAAPDLLICSPNLKAAALNITRSALVSGGETNPWAGSAEVVSVPGL